MTAAPRTTTALQQADAVAAATFTRNESPVSDPFKQAAQQISQLLERYVRGQ